MADTRPSKFRVALSEFFQANGLLVTVFFVAAILVAGLTLVEAPENWWIAALAIAGAFTGLFLLVNARVVIKILVSAAVALFSAAFAFQSGVLIDPSGSGSFVWFLGVFVVYFGSLTASYLLTGGSSRWTLMSLVALLYFAGVGIVASSGLSLSLVAAAGVPTAIALYCLLYRFNRKSRFSDVAMPRNSASAALDDSLAKAAEYADLESRPISKDGKDFFVVWGERSYLLYPVRLNQAFGVIGKKRHELSYEGKALNAWLRHLVFNLVPHRKARGADIMVVLVDTSNANGKDVKTIGVSLPDSKSVVPVGVIPGKLLVSKDEAALRQALQSLDPSFRDFVDALTPKQREALESFGKERTQPKKPKNF